MEKPIITDERAAASYLLSWIIPGNDGAFISVGAPNDVRQHILAIAADDRYNEGNTRSSIEMARRVLAELQLSDRTDSEVADSCVDQSVKDLARWIGSRPELAYVADAIDGAASWSDAVRRVQRQQYLSVIVTARNVLSGVVEMYK